MTYRKTILNLSTTIFLVVITIYTILNYTTLSKGEGWGIVAMTGLISIGVLVGIIDLILQQIIRSKMVENAIGLIIVIGVALTLLLL